MEWRGRAELYAKAVIKNILHRSVNDLKGASILKAKICLIFDSHLRPDNPGKYCLDSLSGLGFPVTHYEPLELYAGRLKFKQYRDLPSGFDLYLQIDDDLAYPGPHHYRENSAYWCIDTHRMDSLIGGGSRLDKATHFSRVFAAQKDGAQALQCTWLPLAVSSSGYAVQKRSATARFDVCFVGNTQFEKRASWLDVITKRFENNFCGRAHAAEQAGIYAATKCILNVPISNDINMRFFEAQFAHNLCLSGRCNNGEGELFEHLPLADDVEEMVDLVQHFIANEKDRHRLADLQRYEMQSKHTYDHRMAFLLHELGLLG